MNTVCKHSAMHNWHVAQPLALRPISKGPRSETRLERDLRCARGDATVAALPQVFPCLNREHKSVSHPNINLSTADTQDQT